MTRGLSWAAEDYLLLSMPLKFHGYRISVILVTTRQQQGWNEVSPIKQKNNKRNRVGSSTD